MAWAIRVVLIRGVGRIWTNTLIPNAIRHPDCAGTTGATDRKGDTSAKADSFPVQPQNPLTKLLNLLS